MGGRRQRERMRANARVLMRRFVAVERCVNCGELLDKNGHFAPPCFGDEGFFICTKKVKEDDGG